MTSKSGWYISFATDEEYLGGFITKEQDQDKALLRAKEVGLESTEFGSVLPIPLHYVDVEIPRSFFGRKLFSAAKREGR